MQITRHADARAYDAPNHVGVTSLRLQGAEATRTRSFWCGLSEFQPGGGASLGAARFERVYVVLDGEITVTTRDGDAVLRRMDSCVIGADEPRAVANRSNAPATVLVVMEQGVPGK